ncbi:hypothetical protein ACFQVD_26785 [Streptosporangium amethystogenes subsp. fukuiense]|uniref:Uncharacterized protein n=1 Tax=Streptosporangium amethystogenes subsp. fukuiense TaxID=698418 RepID=A0ABW2T896_9ACTN
MFQRPLSEAPTSGTGGSVSPGLPTPRARDSKGRGYQDGLPAVVELLPTPTTSEGTGAGHAAQGGMNLRHTISLLPTPRASEQENRQTRRSPSQKAGTHGLCLAAEVAELRPTPRATDGTHGGPNQRGSSGDLMLPSAVQQFLPTPTATRYGSNQSPSPGAAVRPSLDSIEKLLPTPRVSATRTSRGTMLKHSSSPSLEQAIELTSGIVPRELTSLEEAPGSWHGVHTSPPSDAGSTSSDDLPLGQLTIEDALRQPSSNG